MIKTIKKMLWREEGMDFDNNPSTFGSFKLLYGDSIIGILTYDKSQWTFEYSDSFKENPTMSPIIDFPDITKKYVSFEL